MRAILTMQNKFVSSLVPRKVGSWDRSTKHVKTLLVHDNIVYSEISFGIFYCRSKTRYRCPAERHCYRFLYPTHGQTGTKAFLWSFSVQQQQGKHNKEAIFTNKSLRFSFACISIETVSPVYLHPHPVLSPSERSVMEYYTHKFSSVYL